MEYAGRRGCREVERTVLASFTISLRINCVRTSEKLRKVISAFPLPPVPADGLIGLNLGQHFCNVLDKNGLKMGFVIYCDSYHCS